MQRQSPVNGLKQDSSGNMSDSRSILLTLIRSALWDVPMSDLPSDVDWKKVCRLAKQQTLVGLLPDAVSQLPPEMKPDVQKQNQLRAYAVKNIQAHLLITQRLSDVLNVLRSGGVEPVLFKGHGLALNYPDPMSRQCGDIDLYVGKNSYSEAVAICMKQFGKDEHDSESPKHYHFENQGVSVELHRIAENIPGIFNNCRFQKWTVENLESSELRNVSIEGVEVTLPPYKFDAIYVMLHAWHHFEAGGVGLRQLCDWAMYLHRYHEQIDPVSIERDLKAFGLLKVWHLFAWVAVNRLGLSKEECPLYEGKYASAAEKMLEIIWTDGNFGRYSEKRSKRPDGYSSGKIHSMIVTTRRYFRILPVYPFHILNSFILYFLTGVYHYFKGIFR